MSRLEGGLLHWMECREREYNEGGDENLKTDSIQLRAFTTSLKWKSVKVITFPFLIIPFSALLQAEEEIKNICCYFYT